MSVKQVITFDMDQPDSGTDPQSGGTCHITKASITATSQPADFVEKMDPGALVDCVEEEVSHFCQFGDVPEHFSAKEPNRRELLGVLTFAYARRVFDSEEIAHRCQGDPCFRRLCHNHSPFASELIRFRRHYRPLLVTVLANVMMRASQAAPNQLEPASLAALKRQLLCLATTRLDMARHLDTANE